MLHDGAVSQRMVDYIIMMLHQIDVLNIDDTIGGSIQVEDGIPGNNTVSTSNVSGSTTVSSCTCQF
jgi:hypothetical protein